MGHRDQSGGEVTPIATAHSSVHSDQTQSRWPAIFSKLGDLRANRIHFYIDPRGIVFIPRDEAWSYGETVEYSGKDYGLELNDLRDWNYGSGQADDWSDVGGRAMILVGKENQSVMVLHTQSDQLRFEQRLREKGKRNE